MTRLDLTYDSFIWYATGSVQDAINEALPVLQEELERLTPEDTGEMLKSYVKEPASRVWSSVEWSVGNTAEHAIYVEYGGSRAYNYHKPKGNVFYRWVGNRTFARATDAVSETVFNIIRSKLWEQ